MKQVEDNKGLAIVKLNLTQMELERNKPELRALLSQGWIITSMIPVEDNGVPMIVVFLVKNNSTGNCAINRLSILDRAIIIFSSLAIIGCLLYIQY